MARKKMNQPAPHEQRHGYGKGEHSSGKLKLKPHPKKGMHHGSPMGNQNLYGKK